MSLLFSFKHSFIYLLVVAVIFMHADSCTHIVVHSGWETSDWLTRDHVLLSYFKMALEFKTEAKYLCV